MAGAAFITDLTEVATQIAEAAAGVAGILNAFDILKVSRDYYNLYKSQREYYYSTFQSGVELPLVIEVGNIPRYELAYAARLETLSDPLGPFGGESGNADGWWQRHAGMYNSVKDSRITELAPDIVRVVADWANYLYRYEEHWFDVRNDIRWDRRLKLHNIGIKQGSAVSAALASSLANYQDEMEQTGAQLATFGNGAAKFAGYRRGLNDVDDRFNSGLLPGENTKTYMLASNTANRPNKPIPYEADTYGVSDTERSFFEVLR